MTLVGQISDPAELPDESVISAITLAELSVGPHVANDGAERAARQQHLQQAEADFDVLPFDGDFARALADHVARPDEFAVLTGNPPYSTPPYSSPKERCSESNGPSRTPELP